MPSLALVNTTVSSTPAGVNVPAFKNSKQENVPVRIRSIHVTVYGNTAATYAIMSIPATTGNAVFRIPLTIAAIGTAGMGQWNFVFGSGGVDIPAGSFNITFTTDHATNSTIAGVLTYDVVN